MKIRQESFPVEFQQAFSTSSYEKVSYNYHFDVMNVSSRSGTQITTYVYRCNKQFSSSFVTSNYICFSPLYVGSCSIIALRWPLVCKTGKGLRYRCQMQKQPVIAWLRNMLRNSAIGFHDVAAHTHRISTNNTNSPLWLHSKNEEKTNKQTKPSPADIK